jgi:DNA primase catalytic core
MARIPDEELQRLKHDVAIERLAAARGIGLKPSGNNLIGLCPFHDDHEPSLVIAPDKNLWHCLGACQQGGSVIDWVMKAEGVSFRHAVELLRADPPLSSSGAIAKRTRIPKLPALLTPTAADQELLQQVLTHYQQNLTKTPEALAYLEKRGLQSSEMLTHFRLGFANRTLGYWLPAKTRVAGAEIRTRLQRLGILRDSGHEHFSGCVVIPICDAQGHITEIYGRKITHGLRPGTPLHLYLPGPHVGVWNLPAFHASKEIILCEALLVMR